MKNMKKILVTVVAALLLMTVTVMGTLAYLTSTSDQVTNTFTVGKVAITLDELLVDEDGKASPKTETVDGKEVTKTRGIKNTYKLMPGHEYTKDPTVHVEKGSEPCYLYVKVTNEIAGIEATDNTIAAQMSAKGWTALDANKYPGVYYYKEVVNALEEAEDVVVFEKFKIKADLAKTNEDGTITDDNAVLAEYNNKTVTVIAYAIQEDGFEVTDGKIFATQALAAMDAAKLVEATTTTPEEGGETT